jgi:hypothetical protein
LNTRCLREEQTSAVERISPRGREEEVSRKYIVVVGTSGAQQEYPTWYDATIALECSRLVYSSGLARKRASFGASFAAKRAVEWVGPRGRGEEEESSKYIAAYMGERYTYVTWRISTA